MTIHRLNNLENLGAVRSKVNDNFTFLETLEVAPLPANHDLFAAPLPRRYYRRDGTTGTHANAPTAEFGLLVILGRATNALQQKYIADTGEVWVSFWNGTTWTAWADETAFERAVAAMADGSVILAAPATKPRVREGAPVPLTVDSTRKSGATKYLTDLGVASPLSSDCNFFDAVPDAVTGVDMQVGNVITPDVLANGRNLLFNVTGDTTVNAPNGQYAGMWFILTIEPGAAACALILDDDYKLQRPGALPEDLATGTGQYTLFCRVRAVGDIRTVVTRDLL